jgi:hypothetical protein
VSQYERGGNFYDDDEEDPVCPACGGEGRILVCPDDMCHGLARSGEECMHGDGYILCGTCEGEGLC